MKSILYVEDVAVDVFLVEKALRETNSSVELHTRADGEAAIAWLKEREQAPAALPVLILLDLKLPKISGLGVLSWIRGQRRLRCLPVVILSSSEQENDIIQAYKAGANSYLVKPVEYEELIKIMHAVHLYWIETNRLPPGRPD